MVKDEAIAQIGEVFRRYGYEGGTLARLSEATGLGRASLYHHFPQGKEGMAAAVLDHVYGLLQEHLLAPLSGAGSPEKRIRAMCVSLIHFYNGGQNSCFLDVLSLGEAQILFQEPIQRALGAWLEALSQVLTEAGCDYRTARERAEDAIIRIEGALVLSRCLGDTTPFMRTVERLPEQLLQHTYSKA